MCIILLILINLCKIFLKICHTLCFFISEPDVSEVFGHDNNGGRFSVSGVQAHPQNNTSGYHVNPQFVATAKRHSTGRERSPATTPIIKRARRKFPGPAGLLPKLVR